MHLLSLVRWGVPICNDNNAWINNDILLSCAYIVWIVMVNVLLPIKIGSPEVTYPRINNISVIGLPLAFI